MGELPDVDVPGILRIPIEGVRHLGRVVATYGAAPVLNVGKVRPERGPAPTPTGSVRPA